MGHEAHNDHRLFALRGIWRYAGKRHPFVMQAGDAPVACASAAVRLLETTSPPKVHWPPDGIRTDLPRRAPGQSSCECEGQADSLTAATVQGTFSQAVLAGDALSAGCVDVRGYLAFYANRVTSFGDGERVRGQAGRFNRDRVTKALVGLCTGDPSTRAW